MLSVSSLALIMLAVWLSIPVAVLFAEVVAALAFVEENSAIGFGAKSPKKLAVIIPAHNEARGIVPTIEDIKPQLRFGDRLIVVADNCTDDTAAVASSAGAEVISRDDLTQIGKGYALGWAINHISIDPPDFRSQFSSMLIVEFKSDGIVRLQAACSELQRLRCRPAFR